MKCLKGRIIHYQNLNKLSIYTFKEKGQTNCFDLFIDKFDEHPEYKAEFQRISATILEFSRRGIDFRKFRRKGEQTVEALLAGDFNLRLYCIPLGAHEILLGNGDVKSARSVQDCKNCRSHWELMVALEQQLMDRIQSKEIWREGGLLSGELYFELGDCD